MIKRQPWNKFKARSLERQVRERLAIAATAPTQRPVLFDPVPELPSLLDCEIAPEIIFIQEIVADVNEIDKRKKKITAVEAYKQAKDLYDDGQLPKAKKILNKFLKSFPKSKRLQQLKKQIEAENGK